ncbi:hypothetical protein DNI29_21985 [Hymenobacter sediminis]|uniref:hypothetical protein n=1 Tax=Hymenobacter sediminis TaxID=2218621 RepID=UPI000F4E0411|nr:hypothetical protein [Hymenobacter sediminis]RPD44377.1 hypothetical protein DNI29_21985 [Hymenobacter sediminis]
MSKTFTVSMALLGLLSLASCKKDSEVTPPSIEAKPMVYTTVRTLAGTGRWGFQDGPGATAKFDGPDGVAVDGQGNVYVSDVENRAVRKITPTGVVSTLFALSTPYSSPGFSTFDLAVDPQNNVFIATTDARILKLSPGGTVSTVAGSGQFGYQDGPAASAKF